MTHFMVFSVNVITWLNVVCYVVSIQLPLTSKGMLLDYYKTLSNKTPQIGNFGEYRTFVRHGGLSKEFAVLTRGQSKHNSLEGDETFNVPFLKRIQLKRAGFPRERMIRSFKVKKAARGPRYSIRGKKIPAGFVAVRGKKWDS
ncbi:uncharacterized protein LOC136042006 isoform X3 [Artemia franciscana]|uniref:uncharacterized protein LOC136042006 isoform X3 n=1 Tax=Artemia franciscana TaxID=6661 RepID=UPI0032DB1961